MRGITLVDGRAEHRYRGRAALEGAGVGRSVDAGGHARHHNHPAAAQLKAQALGHDAPIGRGVPLAHHGHGGQAVEIRQPSPDVQHQGWVINIAQPVWIFLLADGEDANMLQVAPAQDLVG